MKDGSGVVFCCYECAQMHCVKTLNLCDFLCLFTTYGLLQLVTMNSPLLHDQLYVAKCQGDLREHPVYFKRQSLDTIESLPEEPNLWALKEHQIMISQSSQSIITV